MIRTFAFTLILTLLIVPIGSAQTDSAPPVPYSPLVQWYHTEYPFVTMEDTIFTWESEFTVPDGFHRPDSSELTPFQNWISHFPLWHQYKGVGIWKGGMAFDKTQIARVVHIPWRGPVYTDKGFPFRILAEYLRREHREYEMTVTPRAGDTLTYARWLKTKEGYDGRGGVKLIDAVERDSSAFEFYRYLSVCMKNQSYQSLAGNCDSIKAEQLRPGDLVIAHDDRGMTGRVYVIMNMLVNDSGERLYAIGTGCPEACDFHIPLVNLDRDFPWLTPAQLDSLTTDYPKRGYFRLYPEHAAGT